MSSRNHAILSFLSLIAAVSNVTSAKSLYVINDTEGFTLEAYKIEGTNLAWQTEYTCYSQPYGGAVGLALDESEYGIIERVIRREYQHRDGIEQWKSGEQT